MPSTATATATNTSATAPALGRVYEWSGRTAQGEARHGQITAASPDAARWALARKGVVAERIRAVRPQLWAGRSRPMARTAFLRQLAALVRAGLPLVQALQLVGQAVGGSDPGLAAVAEQLRASVAAGGRLSEGMARHPAVFTPMQCRLVAIGEESGLLDHALERMASHQERDFALRRRLRGALLYPAVVLIVAAAVVAAILVFVVPTFEAVFASMGAELPAATRAVMAMSALLVSVGPWLLAIGVPGLWGLQRWIAHRPERQRQRDRLLLRLPGIGPALLEGLMARWTRLLAMMLSAGVPLVDALGHLAQGLDNRHAEAVTRDLQRAVANGQGLAAAMAVGGLFPPIVRQMVGVGDECGALDAMLARTADLLEAEVDTRLDGLTDLIEPVLILTLGAVIGALVLALYRPIFELGSVM